MSDSPMDPALRARLDEMADPQAAHERLVQALMGRGWGRDEAELEVQRSVAQVRAERAAQKEEPSE